MNIRAAFKHNFRHTRLWDGVSKKSPIFCKSKRTLDDEKKLVKLATKLNIQNPISFAVPTI